MAIEMYFNTDKVFRFPILPKELMRDLNTNFDRDVVQGLGEIAIFNSNGLAEINIECFFPRDNFPYASYSNYPSPSECVEYFGVLRQNGKQGRFILTGGYRDINQEMYIESFSYGQQNNKGISYTLKLVEYRELKLATVQSTASKPSTNNNSRPSNNTNTNSTKTHKVVKGDSLWKLAQKYYGNGSLYPRIVEKNKNKYPNLVKSPSYIRDGWVLTI